MLYKSDKETIAALIPKAGQVAYIININNITKTTKPNKLVNNEKIIKMAYFVFRSKNAKYMYKF